MRGKFILLFLCFMHGSLFAQKQKADSLYKLLAIEKIDSNRVKLMWNIGIVANVYDPEKAFLVTSEALSIAKQIKYLDGESRSYGILANIFQKFGNSPRALEFNFLKLKIEENRNRPANLASVLMNIGIVYALQEEYTNALVYYYKADSVIEANHVENLKYNIALNIGDTYDRLNNIDSAYTYFNKSLVIAHELKNTNFIGASLTGLGHSYRKKENYLLSLASYQSSIPYIKEADDDDLLCEATLGLATLYQKTNKPDSAFFYASWSLTIAKNAGFLPRQLDAVKFLSEYYKQVKNVDSAFLYLNYVKTLNDSINSKERIRESQILSSNEQLRQLEIAENKKIAAKERKQQLQLLFIAIFIPGFFLLTLLFSRIKIHIRAVKILGILSLLILFEYLTLLLHPYVATITNHTPVIEMFIFVSIAAVLIPAHHRIETWLIQWLIKNRPIYAGNKIKLKTTRIRKKY